MTQTGERGGSFDSCSVGKDRVHPGGMSFTHVMLDEGEVQRRSQAWHALAALQGHKSAKGGPLFATDRASATHGVRRTAEGALHVSGQVPIDCLKLYDVMD